MTLREIKIKACSYWIIILFYRSTRRKQHPSTLQNALDIIVYVMVATVVSKQKVKENLTLKITIPQRVLNSNVQYVRRRLIQTENSKGMKQHIQENIDVQIVVKRSCGDAILSVILKYTLLIAILHLLFARKVFLLNITILNTIESSIKLQAKLG